MTLSYLNKGLRCVVLLGLLAAAPAAGQVHISQPFRFFWDWTGAVDRFEMKLDAGVYANVGLPGLVAGTYSLSADPALIGSHSAVVRACTVAMGCTPDSNILAFVVDPVAVPPPSAENLRVAVGGTLPPTLLESPTGTKVFVVGVDKIIDSNLATWTLGPADPLVQGGFEPVILINGAKQGSIATFLCYSNHQVAAWSKGSGVDGNWYLYDGTRFQLLSPAVPAGCV